MGDECGYGRSEAVSEEEGIKARKQGSMEDPLAPRRESQDSMQEDCTTKAGSDFTKDDISSNSVALGASTEDNASGNDELVSPAEDTSADHESLQPVQQDPSSPVKTTDASDDTAAILTPSQETASAMPSSEATPSKSVHEGSQSGSSAQPHVADDRPATVSETLIAAQSVVGNHTGEAANALQPNPGLRYPRHRSSQASSIASNATAESSAPEPTIIHGVVLVGFNHSLGPVVDYSYPAYLQEDDDITKSLPFLALPDGAHMHDEDYSCFHLYLPNISTSTVYGISCIRQLRSDDLLRKSADVTRSTVQKAVVVLANKPIFGPIRDKLGVITRAFFAQRDFDETEILEHFYQSLVHAVKDDEQTDESAISMGVSVREIVWKFRMQTLTLFKLLLLQKRVMFYSSQVERLCSFQYALVSLVPLLLLNLEDAASPLLDSRSGMLRKATSLRSSDRKSLLAYLGLPLNLFGKGAFFQPYLPLQQLEMLQSPSYLVGATNSIFQSQRDCPIDVVVNLDTATIEFLNPKVPPMVGLTAADRKWMDDIVRTVESTWNPSDPHRPVGMGYKASDDWLRSRFEEYLTSALSAIKFVDFLVRNQDMAILINPNDPSGLSSFNESWLANFRTTPAFEIWNAQTDPVIFDLVEPKHPCEGQAHVIEDVGIRLANGLHDLHLDERLGPTQEAISKGIATGSEGVWKLYSSVKTDLAKRQAEYRERREREESSKPAVSPASLETTKDVEAERPQLISDQVLAGAAEVGGRAASLATNIGSFFGSRLTKQRSIAQLSSSASVAEAAKTPSPRVSADVAPADADVAGARPRMGLFSSFRSVSGSAPSTISPSSLQPEDKPEVSTTLPSPPIASTFGSFFRRSSSIPSTQGSDLASSVNNPASKASQQSDDLGSGVIALPDDIEDGAMVWSDERLAFVPVIKSTTSQQPHLRNSQSNNEKSDLETMSDVKL